MKQSIINAVTITPIFVYAVLGGLIELPEYVWEIIHYLGNLL